MPILRATPGRSKQPRHGADDNLLQATKLGRAGGVSVEAVAGGLAV
jgi:hypothetical protein